MILFFLACAIQNLETISNKEEYIIIREDSTFPLNEEFVFSFSLLDMNRDPIIPQEVLVDAEMPTHGHGMGQTPTISNTENQYTAEGMLFAMEGDWEIYVYITEESRVDQGTFSIACCE
jgi:Ca2+-binding EF-hand superfamily protein